MLAVLKNELVEDFFKKHIGQRNAVDKYQIIKGIYGNIDKKYNELVWRTIKESMAIIRRRGVIYIVPKRNRIKVWTYFVPTKKEDITEYVEMLGSLSMGCRNNIIKVNNYISKQKYKYIV